MSPSLLLVFFSTLLISGCSAAFRAGVPSAGPAEIGDLNGTVYGGQFPVTGATVNIYEIPNTSSTAAGYAAALPPPLGTTTTDSDGNWTFSGLPSCANASDEIYLVSTGGMEAGNHTPNSALVLTSVGGPCGNWFTTTFNIDEITTVATEYALAGFSSDYQHVGTSTTNTQGLTNAFSTMTSIVNLTSGIALATINVPYETIDTLANILAGCVNDPGGASGTYCSVLFSYTGGSNSLPVGAGGTKGPVATNTADAALYIAHNPTLPSSTGFATSNIGAVWALPTPQAPFEPVLVSAPNTMTLALTVAGNGTGGYSGDGGSATGAELYLPSAVAVDSGGNVYIADTENERIREVYAATGTIATIVGTGAFGLSEYGGPAIGFTLSSPEGIAVERSGNIYIADSSARLILEDYVATETVATIAGNGYYGYSGDGGPATSATFDDPLGVALDDAGNLYIADSQNNAIRELYAATGTIATIAGNGNFGYSGDGGPATSAELTVPDAVALDSAGNLYIADTGNNVIRELYAATGTIATIAGNGVRGSSGDGGPATSAELYVPNGLAVDGAGNVYLPAHLRWGIRKVDAATGIITTIAGNGSGGESADNPQFFAYGLAVDNAGNLYICDQDYSLIRELVGAAVPGPLP